MEHQVIARHTTTLPADDDHPYRTGAWKPNLVEYDAWDLDVEGELPDDLEGIYLRNTENPLHDSIGPYHPFDGDGMVHAIAFSNGEATYRNRLVATAGIAGENEAGGPLWAGLPTSPKHSLRDGWGARTRLKDASSTDVVVHRGMALTAHYQCGDAYQLDPATLAQAGPVTWGGEFPSDWGISAHPKVDPRTGELLFFSYSKQHPYLRYGVVDAAGNLVHHIGVELPGPRLPHDMAFTERFAILNDCPMFWDPDLLARDIHAPKFFADLPTRFAVVPRRGGPDEVRWFEAEPTYVLHWINAYEDGDEVVLDGFRQHDPSPAKRPDADGWAEAFRFLDYERFLPRPHRWRFNLRTGSTTEEPLADDLLEFGMIDPRRAGLEHRYAWAATGKPGWFLFDGLVRLDVTTGDQQRYMFPDGVTASEAPMAPRSGAPEAGGPATEDDGYLVTFTTDLANDRSQCLVFSAADLEAGPIARVNLPERICAGTHSWWAPAGTY